MELEQILPMHEPRKSGRLIEESSTKGRVLLCNFHEGEQQLSFLQTKQKKVNQLDDDHIQQQHPIITTLKDQHSAEQTIDLASAPKVVSKYRIIP
jgi:hypothetical protein